MTRPPVPALWVLLAQTQCPMRKPNVSRHRRWPQAVSAIWGTTACLTQAAHHRHRPSRGEDPGVSWSFCLFVFRRARWWYVVSNLASVSHAFLTTLACAAFQRRTPCWFRISVPARRVGAPRCSQPCQWASSSCYPFGGRDAMISLARGNQFGSCLNPGPFHTIRPTRPSVWPLLDRCQAGGKPHPIWAPLKTGPGLLDGPGLP